MSGSPSSRYSSCALLADQARCPGRADQPLDAGTVERADVERFWLCEMDCRRSKRHFAEVEYGGDGRCWVVRVLNSIKAAPSAAYIDRASQAVRSPRR